MNEKTTVTNADTRVATLIAKWIRQRPIREGTLRTNIRLVFGSSLGAQVAAQLAADNDTGRAYLVRHSSDEDAVALRNDRGGVGTDKTLVYVVFWQSGSGHDRNAQSLMDLPATDEHELVRDMSLVFNEADKMEARCRAAAEQWEAASRSRAEARLVEAWRALWTCVRTRAGGQRGSVPFARTLGHLLRFLDRAWIDDAVWDALPVAERAEALTRQWGAALPELGLFRTTELAALVGIPTSTAKRVSRQPRQDEWCDAIEELLSDNLEYAQDPALLGEKLAGKRSLEDQLERYKEQWLVRDRAGQPAALTALAQFCHRENDNALERVEWLFHESADSLRTPRRGVMGLLTARNAGPRPTPIEVIHMDTRRLFDDVLRDERHAALRDAMQQWLDRSMKRGVDGWRALHGLLHASDSESLPVIEGLDRAHSETWVETLSESERPRSERFARRWKRLADDAERTGAPVRAPTLLLGVARLLARSYVAGEAVAEGVHSIELEYEQDHRPVRCCFDPANIEKSCEQLRQFAGQIYEKIPRPETEAGDEEQAESEPLLCTVWRSVLSADNATKRSQLGAIELQIDEVALRRHQLTCARLERWTGPAIGEDSRKGVMMAIDKAIGSAPRTVSLPDSLEAVWRRYADSRGPDTDASAWVDLVAPAPNEIFAWVDAWADEVERSTRGGGETIESLTEQREAAIEREDLVQAKRLKARIDELRARHPEGQRTVEEVRALLSLFTIEVGDGDQRTHTLLTRLHPVVSRLWIIEDRTLLSAIQQLVQHTWPIDAQGDIVRPLRDWGWPEPLHCFGAMHGKPFVFDRWIDGHWAMFARHDTTQGDAVVPYGVSAVAAQVDEYARLFPAAAQRLHVRIDGDRDGAWAWGILQRTVLQGDSLIAGVDVDLVTDIDDRAPTMIDRALIEDSGHRSAFEPGRDGAPPRVRVRRVRSDSSETFAPHLALVIGDKLRALRSELEHELPREPMAERWHRSAMFHQSICVPGDNASSVVRDPVDAFATAVARAVGVVTGVRGSTWMEVQTTDPTHCEAGIRRAQRGAHWLVITSRRPLFTAVQRLGATVSTLLDYRSEVERGRPVHVCVSLNAERSSHDLATLRAGLKQIVPTLTDARTLSLVALAQKIAPGLAIQCVSSLGGPELTGLLGLLLSADVSMERNEGAALLSLDRHRELVGSKMRTDLLEIRPGHGEVRLGLIESKASRRGIDTGAAAVDKARQQLAQSRETLKRLTIDHPFAERLRGDLLQAMAEQALASADSRKWNELIELLQRPSVRVVLGGSISDRILLWNLSAHAELESSVSTSGSELSVFSYRDVCDRIEKLDAHPA
ncbi:MAG: hypothetical protein U0269_19690 [Polyangiales bacterium]